MEQLNDLIPQMKKLKGLSSLICFLADKLASEGLYEEGVSVNSACMQLLRRMDDILRENQEFAVALKNEADETVYLATEHTNREYPRLARRRYDAVSHIERLGLQFIEWFRKQGFRVCWTTSHFMLDLSVSLYARREGANGIQTCKTRIAEEGLTRGLGEVSLSIPEDGWGEDEAKSFEKEYWDAIESMVKEELNEAENKKRKKRKSA